MNKFNPVKFSIILTTVCLGLLIGFAVMLPWLVTWYVQIFNRHESLATTIMVTCYPCAPFTAIILMALRKILKNIEQNKKDSIQNIKLLRYMSICCIIISLITFIAGKYYLPFFIVGATFFFLAVIIFAFKSIVSELFTDK